MKNAIAPDARLVRDARESGHVWPLDYCTDDGQVRTIDVFLCKIRDTTFDASPGILDAGGHDYQVRRADTGAILSAWQDEAEAITRAKWKMIDAWRAEVGPEAVRSIYARVQAGYLRR